jgi:hypothetical protein
VERLRSRLPKRVVSNQFLPAKILRVPGDARRIRARRGEARGVDRAHEVGALPRRESAEPRRVERALVELGTFGCGPDHEETHARRVVGPVGARREHESLGLPPGRTGQGTRVEQRSVHRQLVEGLGLGAQHQQPTPGRVEGETPRALEAVREREIVHATGSQGLRALEVILRPGMHEEDPGRPCIEDEDAATPGIDRDALRVLDTESTPVEARDFGGSDFAHAQHAAIEEDEPRAPGTNVEREVDGVVELGDAAVVEPLPALLDQTDGSAGLGRQQERGVGSRREGQRVLDLDVEVVVELQSPDLAWLRCSGGPGGPEEARESENREREGCNRERAHEGPQQQGSEQQVRERERQSVGPRR